MRIFGFATHFGTVAAGVSPAESRSTQPTRLPLQFINRIAAGDGKMHFCSTRVPLPLFVRCHRFGPALS
jgi:hypothetical protein